VRALEVRSEEAVKTWLEVTDRCHFVKRVRRGNLYRWYLHGGSEFREAVFREDDIYQGEDGGPLIVCQVAAATQGIYSGKFFRPPASTAT
jgi:hypothetical protein